MDRCQKKVMQSAAEGERIEQAHFADWAAVIVRLEAEAGLTFREAQQLVPISEGGYMIDEDAKTRRSYRELYRRGMRKVEASGHPLEYYVGSYRPQFGY